jgi:TRAP-type transport system small permease protein
MLERLVTGIEKLAGLFLLAVALLTFVMVLLRKFFDAGIPDWYDFSRLLQGIAILWGIACACYRGAHIGVDLLWDWAGPSNKRRIDHFATAMLALFMIAFAVLALQAAIEMRGNNLLTSDLRWPQWGFYLIGAFGVAGAALATLVRWRSIGRDSSPAAAFNR